MVGQIEHLSRVFIYKTYLIREYIYDANAAYIGHA